MSENLWQLMAALLAMRWFDPSALSGLALISLSLGVLAFFVYGLVCKGLRRRSALSKVVVGALGFQVFHFLEHGLQLGYWFFNTKQKQTFVFAGLSHYPFVPKSFLSFGENQCGE